MKTKHTIYLDIETVRRLKAVSDKYGYTQSQIVQIAIEREVIRLNSITPISGYTKGD